MQETQLLTMFREVAERVEARPLGGMKLSSTISDLGIDSLAMMEIVGELETRLGIYVADEELVRMRTVGDVVGMMHSTFGALAEKDLRGRSRSGRPILTYSKPSRRLPRRFP